MLFSVWRFFNIALNVAHLYFHIHIYVNGELVKNINIEILKLTVYLL